MIIISSHLCWRIFYRSKNITLDKDKNTTVFKDNVSIKTIDKTITSQFAEYNKSKEIIILKDGLAKDKFQNTIQTNYAVYDNNKNLFETEGSTILVTKENYTLEGERSYFDNENKEIKSDKPSILKDLSGNTNLENFEYLQGQTFSSIGKIKILDQYKNTYNFSQLYIDTKKEMLGTNIKAYLNHEDFKINKKNDPRIFANAMKSNDEGSNFSKSIFTLCELKENEKCPPWTLQASEMRHDNKNKTIYYDNAVIKIYDIPVFYTPFLSHPDPTVKEIWFAATYIFR